MIAQLILTVALLVGCVVVSRYRTRLEQRGREERARMIAEHDEKMRQMIADHYRGLR